MQRPVPRTDAAPASMEDVRSPEVPTAPPPASRPAGAAEESADARIAPPGGSPWIRYAALIAIVVVLFVMWGLR